MNPTPVYATSPRRSSSPPRVSRPALLLLLFVGSMLAPMQALSEDSEYWIDACATPLTLTLHGLPSVAGVGLEKTFDICREQAADEIRMLDLGLDARTWQAQILRMPKIAWVPRNGKLDVRVILRDAARPLVYEGLQIAPGAKDVVLLRSGHEEGPLISVSVQRDDGPSRVAMNVVDAKSSNVLRDLVRIKRLKVRNAERITDTPVTFRFQSVRVLSVLQLLADISGVMLHRDGSDGHVFGLNPHAAEIEVLRGQALGFSADSERAELKRTLQRIVELSKSAIDGEPGAPVADVLEQLASMEMDDAQPARAEALQRARTLEIEQSWSGAESFEYAVALADLARTHLAQDDDVAARPMLERALAILAGFDREHSAAGARLLGDLGTLALKDERLDVAADFGKRGFTIVSRPIDGEPDPLMLLRARLVLEDLESGLGEAFAEREQPLVADAHFERALLLDEALWGIDDNLTVRSRQRFTWNAWQMGRPERAASAHMRLIANAQESREVRSSGYANALAHLATIRASEGNRTQAISLARQYVVATEAASGASSSHHVSALRLTELFLRLDRQFDEAAIIEREATAIDSRIDEAAARSESVTMSEADLDTAMIMQLAMHFERKLRAKGAVARDDQATHAYLLENIGETHASAGNAYIAAEYLHQALALLRMHKGPRDVQTLRVARRLMALHERGGSAHGVERVRMELQKE